MAETAVKKVTGHKSGKNPNNGDSTSMQIDTCDLLFYKPLHAFQIIVFTGLSTVPLCPPQGLGQTLHDAVFGAVGIPQLGGQIPKVLP